MTQKLYVISVLLKKTDLLININKFYLKDLLSGTYLILCYIIK